MIERSLDRFDLYPARLLGDSAYGSAEMLGWLVYEHGIEPHVTVFDKSTRQDGTFSRDDFTYDHVGDVYSCPAGSTFRFEIVPADDTSYCWVNGDFGMSPFHGQLGQAVPVCFYMCGAEAKAQGSVKYLVCGRSG